MKLSPVLISNLFCLYVLYVKYLCVFVYMCTCIVLGKLHHGVQLSMRVSPHYFLLNPKTNSCIQTLHKLNFFMLNTNGSFL